jgi:hypothetical protein
VFLGNLQHVRNFLPLLRTQCATALQSIRNQHHPESQNKVGDEGAYTFGQARPDRQSSPDAPQIRY